MYTRMAGLIFRKYLPVTVPPVVNDSIHGGNITENMEYNIVANMAAGTGGNRSRLSSNGTCVMRQI
jgi:hypothetical protein